MTLPPPPWAADPARLGRAPFREALDRAARQPLEVATPAQRGPTWTRVRHNPPRCTPPALQLDPPRDVPR